MFPSSSYILSQRGWVRASVTQRRMGSGEEAVANPEQAATPLLPPRTHSPMEGMGKNGGQLCSRPVLELSLE